MENIYTLLLDIEGPNIEVLSYLGLQELLILGGDERVQNIAKNELFWKKWVQRNVSPRHTDAFIESIPGKMRWRYYARLHGRIEGSELYKEIISGYDTRFFPYLEVDGIQAIRHCDSIYMLLINGRPAILKFDNYDKLRYSEWEPELLYSEWMPAMYVRDVVYLKTFTRGYIVIHILLLDSEGDLYTQEIRVWKGVSFTLDLDNAKPESLVAFLKHKGFFGSYKTKKDLVDAAKSANGLYRTFGPMVKIAFGATVVAISPSHILTETGEVYNINYASPSNVGFSEDPSYTRCLWINPTDKGLIFAENAVDRLIEVFGPDLETSNLIHSTTEWDESGYNSTYICSANKGNCPGARDKSIPIHGIRGWYKSNAAWTLDGKLYVASHTLDLRSALGIQDFVVTCMYPTQGSRLAATVPLQRSAALQRALDELQDDETRTLAKLLQYPLSLQTLSINRLREVLSREPFSIVNKIILIPHIEKYLEMTQQPLAVQKRKIAIKPFRHQINAAPQYELGHQSQYKTAEDYARAEKLLLEEMPELKKSQYDPTRHRATKKVNVSVVLTDLTEAALAKQRVNDLRKAAAALKIKGRSKMRKHELIDAILGTKR